MVEEEVVFHGLKTGGESVRGEEKAEKGRVGVRVCIVDILKEARIVEGFGDVVNFGADIDAAALSDDVEVFPSKQDLFLDSFELWRNVGVSNGVSFLPVFVCIIFLQFLAPDALLLLDQKFGVRVLDSTMMQPFIQHRHVRSASIS